MWPCAGRSQSGGKPVLCRARMRTGTEAAIVVVGRVHLWTGVPRPGQVRQVLSARLFGSAEAELERLDACSGQSHRVRSRLRGAARGYRCQRAGGRPRRGAHCLPRGRARRRARANRWQRDHHVGARSRERADRARVRSRVAGRARAQQPSGRRTTGDRREDGQEPCPASAGEA